MKKSDRFGLVMTVVLLAAWSSVWAGENLIYNSSFELDAAGWRSRPIIEVGPAHPYATSPHGKKYLNMLVPQCWWPEPPLKSRLYKLTPGMKYTFSGYFRSSDFVGGKLKVTLFRPKIDKYTAAVQPGAEVASKIITLKGEWTRESLTGTVGDSPETDNLYFFLVTAAPDEKGRGSVDVDALQLEPGELTPYKPAAEVEYAVEMPYTPDQLWQESNQFFICRLYDRKQPAKITVRGLRYDAAMPLQKPVEVTVKNLFEKNVFANTGTLTWPAKQTLATLEVDYVTDQPGIFRAEAGDPQEAIHRGQLVFGVVHPAKGLKKASHFGHAVYRFTNPLEMSQTLAKKIGIGSIRLHCYTRHSDWRTINPELDKWVFWPDAKATEDRLNADLLGILGEPPGWAMDQSIPRWIKNLEQLERYADRTAQYYKNEITDWEIFNEPWFCSGKDYVPLLKAAWTGAKKGNPNCRVVGICGAPWRLADLQDAMANGAGQYMDTFSYHDYGQFPVDEIEEKVSAGVREMQAVLKHYSGRDIPLWNTECGCWSQPFYNDTPAFSSYGYSARDGASWVARMYVPSFAAGVEKIYGFLIVPSFYSTDDPGLPAVDFTGAPRAQILALAALIRFVDDKAFVSRITLAGGRISAYLFANQQEQVLVYWGNQFKDLTGSLMTTLPKDRAAVYDVMGADITANADGTTWQLPVRTEPHFVVLKKKMSPGALEKALRGRLVTSYGEFDQIKNQFAGALLRGSCSAGEVAIHPLINGYRFTADSGVAGVYLINRGSQPLRVACPPAAATPLFWQQAGEAKAQKTHSFLLPPKVPLAVFGTPSAAEIASSLTCDETIIDRDARLYAAGYTTPGLAVQLTNFSNHPVKAEVRIDRLPGNFGTPPKAATALLKAGDAQALFVPFAAYALSKTDIKEAIAFEVTTGGKKASVELPVKVAYALEVGQAPKIDGDLSDWTDEGTINLADRSQVVLQANPKHPWAGARDASATARIRWNKDFVFLAIAVTDNQVVKASGYNGDGVELVFDNDLLLDPWAKAYSFDDQQLFINPRVPPQSPEISEAATPLPPTGDLYGDKIKVRAASTLTADGYLLEVAIPAVKLRNLKLCAGNLVGFDLALNDGDGGDTGDGRNAQLCWAGTADNYRNPRVFGTLLFLPKSR